MVAVRILKQLFDTMAMKKGSNVVAKSYIVDIWSGPQTGVASNPPFIKYTNVHIFINAILYFLSVLGQYRTYLL